MVVYVLEHSYERETCGCDESKLIGVYATRERAQQAIERLTRKPGFADHPSGFNIDAHEVDQDSWQQGFEQRVLGEGE